ncbi:unnamed protein product, partial [Allacma fusca]
HFRCSVFILKIAVGSNKEDPRTEEVTSEESDEHEGRSTSVWKSQTISSYGVAQSTVLKRSVDHGIINSLEDDEILASPESKSTEWRPEPGYDESSVNKSESDDSWKSVEVETRPTDFVQVLKTSEGGRDLSSVTAALPTDLESSSSSTSTSPRGEQQEKLLLNYLMQGYERDVRPVRNSSWPVVIEVGITLTQIFDM